MENFSSLLFLLFISLVVDVRIALGLSCAPVTRVCQSGALAVNTSDRCSYCPEDPAPPKILPKDPLDVTGGIPDPRLDPLYYPKPDPCRGVRVYCPAGMHEVRARECPVCVPKEVESVDLIQGLNLETGVAAEDIVAANKAMYTGAVQAAFGVAQVAAAVKEQESESAKDTNTESIAQQSSQGVLQGLANVTLGNRALGAGKKLFERYSRRFYRSAGFSSVWEEKELAAQQGQSAFGKLQMKESSFEQLLSTYVPDFEAVVGYSAAEYVRSVNSSGSTSEVLAAVGNPKFTKTDFDKMLAKLEAADLDKILSEPEKKLDLDSVLAEIDKILGKEQSSASKVSGANNGSEQAEPSEAKLTSGQSQIHPGTADIYPIDSQPKKLQKPNIFMRVKKRLLDFYRVRNFPSY